MSRKKRTLQLVDVANLKNLITADNKIDAAELISVLTTILQSVDTPDDYVTLTDAATVSWDMNVARNKAKVTLGGNRTLSITNALAGDSGILRVTQDGTGGRSLSFSGTFKTNGGFISTTIGATSLIEWDYDGTTFFFSISQYS